ncbi:MAG: hypothetical protein EPGJADBJ_05129 [Saprospiraceae bacterium]|nr:hypothetical protein [Saprospiraceae bacterium]
MSALRINIEQTRAAKAYEYASAGKPKGNYEAHVRKMPMYILNNGLTNALAFAYSKQKEEGWQEMYKQLTQWFRTDDPQQIIRAKLSNDEDLMKVVANLDDQTLRLVTAEAIALFVWLRRFVSEDAMDD